MKYQRKINMRTGYIEETDTPLIGIRRARKFKLTDTINDFDATQKFYEYGFTWSPTRVSFYIWHEGKRIDLWDFEDSYYIPTHPAKLMFNVWHNKEHWHKFWPDDNTAAPPSNDAVFQVDYVKYNKNTFNAPGGDYVNTLSTVIDSLSDLVHDYTSKISLMGTAAPYDTVLARLNSDPDIRAEMMGDMILDALHHGVPAIDIHLHKTLIALLLIESCVENDFPWDRDLEWNVFQDRMTTIEDLVIINGDGTINENFIQSFINVFETTNLQLTSWPLDYARIVDELCDLIIERASDHINNESMEPITVEAVLDSEVESEFLILNELNVVREVIETHGSPSHTDYELPLHHAIEKQYWRAQDLRANQAFCEAFYSQLKSQLSMHSQDSEVVRIDTAVTHTIRTISAEQKEKTNGQLIPFQTGFPIVSSFGDSQYFMKFHGKDRWNLKAYIAGSLAEYFSLIPDIISNSGSNGIPIENSIMHQAQLGLIGYMYYSIAQGRQYNYVSHNVQSSHYQGKIATLQMHGMENYNGSSLLKEQLTGGSIAESFSKLSKKYITSIEILIPTEVEFVNETEEGDMRTPSDVPRSECSDSADYSLQFDVTPFDNDTINGDDSAFLNLTIEVITNETSCYLQLDVIDSTGIIIRSYLDQLNVSTGWEIVSYCFHSPIPDNFTFHARLLNATFQLMCEEYSHQVGLGHDSLNKSPAVKFDDIQYHVTEFNISISWNIISDAELNDMRLFGMVWDDEGNFTANFSETQHIHAIVRNEGSHNITLVNGGLYRVQIFAMDSLAIIQSSSSMYIPVNLTTQSIFIPENITEELIDSNNDTLHESLQFSIPYQSQFSRNVTIIGRLLDSEGTVLETIRNDTRITGGNGSFTLGFNGFALSSYQFNGSLTLDISLYDSQGIIIEVFPGGYSTDVYNNSQFERHDTEITEYLGDKLVDLNNNSLADVLEVAFGVSSSAVGNYSITSALVSNGSVIDVATNTTYITIGNHSIALNFSGAAIRRCQMWGNYEVVILSTNHENSTVGTPVGSLSTAHYLSNQFEYPEISFTTILGEEVWDSDNDTLYEQLNLSVKLNITVQGDYHISGDLVDGDGQDVELFMIVKNLPIGNTTITFIFDGVSIHRNSWNGSFNVTNLQILGENGTVYDTWNDAWITSHYSFNEFQAPPIGVVDPIVSEFNDTDHDGFWNDILLNCTVNVTESGSYDIRGYLYHSNGTFLDSTNLVTYLPIGEHEVTTVFQDILPTQYAFNNQSLLVKYLEIYSSTLDLFEISYVNQPLYVDYSSPTITINSSMNNTLLKGGRIVPLNVSDVFLDEVVISVNGGQFFTLDHQLSFDTDGWTSGSYSIEIIATDMANNSAHSLLNFSLDADAPRVHIQSPWNSTIIRPGTELHFNITDEHLHRASYSVNNAQHQEFVEQYILNTTIWRDGNYSIEIITNDTVGNIDVSTFRIIVDSEVPMVSLLSPPNHDVISAGTIIDLHIEDENPFNATFRIDEGLKNTFLYPHTIDTTGWAEGNHTIEIEAIDEAGNAIIREYQIILDSMAPSIRLETPLNNSNIQPGGIISFSVLDDHLETVSFSMNHGPISQLSPPYALNTTSWNDGEYLIEILATDRSDNANVSWYSITIDSTAPAISLDNQHNNTKINNAEHISISIQDENSFIASYSLNDGESQPFGFQYILNLSSWAEGENILKIMAIDDAGNEAYLEFIFTIDSLRPVIQIPDHMNNSVISADTTIPISVDDLHLVSLEYSINYGSFETMVAPYDIHTQGWDSGAYHVRIRARDAANNSAESSISFVVDATSPTVLSTTPGNNESSVPVITVIVIEFSEKMNLSTVQRSIVTIPSMNFSSMIWNENGTILTGKFASNLTQNSSVLVLVGTSATDVVGNRMMQEYHWWFSTWSDLDEDGIPDTIDEDIDGDGIDNVNDTFPSNAAEWIDTDNDGIGDNEDQDDDNDHMPDSYEQSNGFNSKSSHDATLDFDGDGFSNLQEYQLLTDPKDSESKPIQSSDSGKEIPIFSPLFDALDPYIEPLAEEVNEQDQIPILYWDRFTSIILVLCGLILIAFTRRRIAKRNGKPQKPHEKTENSERDQESSELNKDTSFAPKDQLFGRQGMDSNAMNTKIQYHQDEEFEELVPDD